MKIDATGNLMSQLSKNMWHNRAEVKLFFCMLEESRGFLTVFADLIIITVHRKLGIFNLIVPHCLNSILS